MATLAQPIVKCILDYLYSITDTQLDKLRAIIEAAIVFIDTQILLLKAQLAALDIPKNLTEAAWNIAEAFIEQIISTIAGGIPGPADDICPDFYQYITAPILQLNKATLSAFSPLKDRYMKYISVVYYFEELLSYWEQAKATMIAIMDVTDDAIYLAKEQLGNRVP